MFSKNLEVLDNNALKAKLAGVSTQKSRENISYVVTPSNDYVLLKNEIPTDDLNNPREAVKSHLDSVIKNEMKPSDLIVVFGIGLGYLLDEVFNRYPSRIYLYEPDLELLRFVLENIDISEHLSSGRVYITNDIDQLAEKISQNYITKDRVEIVYLKNYAIAKNQELLLLTQKVYDSCKNKIVDINTISKFSKLWLTNTIDNIAYINNNEAYRLSDLENKFCGQTALIAAAGPSLDDNIEKIQANRSKFAVFAVNKAVKYLIRNGIIPDFIVCLDSDYVNKTLSGVEKYFERVNCIMDIRTDKSIVNKGFRRILFNFSTSDSLSAKLLEYNKGFKMYESGGSAATLALVAAIKAGFSKIVFAGLDLAFKNNIAYADGETIQRLNSNEIKAGEIKKRIVSTKSVTGGEVQTSDDYLTFINHLEILIKGLDYSEIYNISSFGAHINGIKNCRFDDLNLDGKYSLSGTYEISPVKINFDEFMNNEFKIINNIISYISKGTFSGTMISEIVKSGLLYQYMQKDILNILQNNLNPILADGFMECTKLAIRTVIEQLQKNKLI